MSEPDFSAAECLKNAHEEYASAASARPDYSGDQGDENDARPPTVTATTVPSSQAIPPDQYALDNDGA